MHPRSDFSGTILIAIQIDKFMHNDLSRDPTFLVVFGRGCEEARESLERALDGSGIELRVSGFIPAEEITRTLASAHALLCIRGLITSRDGCRRNRLRTARRGFRANWERSRNRHHRRTASSLARLRGIVERLIELLTDEKLWPQLHEKNVRALEQYFSWGTVADRYMKLLASN